MPLERTMELCALTACLSLWQNLCATALELGKETGSYFSWSDSVALKVGHWERTVALVFLACFS